MLPDDYWVVLVGDMITEEALPTYMAMLNTLDGVRDETGAAQVSTCSLPQPDKIKSLVFSSALYCQQQTGVLCGLGPDKSLLHSAASPVECADSCCRPKASNAVHAVFPQV